MANKTKRWVVVKPMTGLKGWLVAIPAGPAVKKGNPPRIVGYVGYSAWVRVARKDEAQRLARLGDSVGIARADRLADACSRDLLIVSLGHWPVAEAPGVRP